MVVETIPASPSSNHIPVTPSRPTTPPPPANSPKSSLLGLRDAAIHILPSPACGRGAGGEGTQNRISNNLVQHNPIDPAALCAGRDGTLSPAPLPQAGEGNGLMVVEGGTPSLPGGWEVMQPPRPPATPPKEGIPISLPLAGEGRGRGGSKKRKGVQTLRRFAPKRTTPSPGLRPPSPPLAGERGGRGDISGNPAHALPTTPPFGHPSTGGEFITQPTRQPRQSPHRRHRPDCATKQSIRAPIDPPKQPKRSAPLTFLSPVPCLPMRQPVNFRFFDCRFRDHRLSFHPFRCRFPMP
jgi:hypothetical protein